MNPFDYNDKPTDEMIQTMESFRAKFKELAEMSEALPKSRERSLFMTKIEEASMWINKSISHKIPAVD